MLTYPSHPSAARAESVRRQRMAESRLAGAREVPNRTSGSSGAAGGSTKKPDASGPSERAVQEAAEFILRAGRDLEEGSGSREESPEARRAAGFILAAGEEEDDADEEAGARRAAEFITGAGR